MAQSELVVRRRTKLVQQMVRSARARVLVGGLDGFTVEDLAREANVSRRTFFNYFASKEHAVLGIAAHIQPRGGEAEFLARAGTGHAGLMEDLGELVMARLESYVSSAEELAGLIAVMQQVPRLRARAMQLLREQADEDVRLVERREGLPPGNPRARLAVDVVGLLVDRVIAERLAGRAGSSFRGRFRELLAHTRAVMEPGPGERG